MGLHFSRIWERMFGKREMRILMVGLDAAGKVRHYSMCMNIICCECSEILTINSCIDYHSLQA